MIIGLIIVGFIVCFPTDSPQSQPTTPETPTTSETATTPETIPEPIPEIQLPNKYITSFYYITMTIKERRRWPRRDKIISCPYKISFGYDNIHEIIGYDNIHKIIANHDSLRNSCNGNVDAPKILEIYSIKEKHQCLQLDSDLIIKRMEKENILENAQNQGKLWLRSSVQPYCQHMKP